jgi:hypothetical protein
MFALANKDWDDMGRMNWNFPPPHPTQVHRPHFHQIRNPLLNIATPLGNRKRLIGKIVPHCKSAYCIQTGQLQ